ncbi:MAG: ABC transporter ATP-binding protein [Actinomycetaceae bacterium]|nr:ABC transporter ATP-binding protein [Actinomycetaceae bacterium]
MNDSHRYFPRRSHRKEVSDTHGALEGAKHVPFSTASEALKELQVRHGSTDANITSPAIISFCHVTKVFQDGSEKINAVNATTFDIFPGEFVAIVGPSGSGKSTLLTLMGGLQKPTDGKITLDGQSLDSMKSKALVKLRLDKIGFILQTSHLIPYLCIEDQLKVVDRVRKTSFDATRSQQLLEQLNIWKLRSSFPSDISGGERQRAAIARALYPDPALILADEPTASLDSQRAFDVVKILADAAHDRNKAVVMVTHDERMLHYCDRVFRMSDGDLSEELISR